MEDVFAAVDARPKRRQGVTGQTFEAQMRGTMCQISEYELDMLRDEITRLTAEREQAIADSAAREIAMRDRAAECEEKVGIAFGVCRDETGDEYNQGWIDCTEHWLEEIRALPLSPDATAALNEMLAKAREDAIREAADIVNKNRDISGWVSHDAILALLNDGGRDE